jgi:hypothetical protein
MTLKPRNCVSRGESCPELALFLQFSSHVASIGLLITNLSDIVPRPRRVRGTTSDHFSPITLRRAPDLSLSKVTLAQRGLSPFTFHLSPIPSLSITTWSKSGSRVLPSMSNVAAAKDRASVGQLYFGQLRHAICCL